MPRRPDKPQLPLEELETWACLAAAAEDKLPHDALLLRQIITAMLTRTRTRDEGEAKFLEGLGQYLAGAERDPRLIDKQRFYTETLKAIASAPVPRKSTHYLGSLNMQRKLLAHFLSEYPFPTSANKRWDWVKQYWKDIVKLLDGFPCGCNYSRTLEPLNEDAVTTWVTDLDVMLRILAHLHNSAPTYIQKLLSAAK
ncbi:hypothetical protein [Nitrospira sp. Nam74]